MPPDLLGPTALLAGALIAVGVLWREHTKADADDRAQRDQALALLAVALAGNTEAAVGSKAMAAAWDERNRIDNERNRADAVRRRKADS